MADTATRSFAAGDTAGETTEAIALTACAALLWVVLIGAEASTMLWSMLGLLAAAAAVAAFRAGGGMPRHRCASAALVVSDLVLVTSLGYLVTQL